MYVRRFSQLKAFRALCEPFAALAIFASTADG